MDPRFIFLGLAFLAVLVIFSGPERPKILSGDEAFQARIQQSLQAKDKQGPFGAGGSGVQGLMSPVDPLMGPGTPKVPVLSNPSPFAGALPQAAEPGAAANMLFLNDGRRLFLNGQRVLVQVGDGNVQPLPDGVYLLRNGTKMTINKGRRIPNDRP